MNDTTPPVLVFATHNAHKAREVQALLGNAYSVQTLSDIGCTEPIPETAETLEGNAQIKAEYVKKTYGLDCFADDTGLEVDALNGAPGVKTARYAGEDADAAANMTKLLGAMEGLTHRSARFRTVICLIRGDQTAFIEGTCVGRIAEAQSGHAGFGYDPVFIPDGHTRSFAEMTSEEKNELSHRGRAVRRMVNTLLESVI